MNGKTKLELTWIGKEERPRLEPRILIEQPEHSMPATDGTPDNLLIHGDNLLALKALETQFTGAVKCIFIDPPYNTGAAFEHYDDGLEHSVWLTLIRERLAILRQLLADDGSLWVSLDDNEAPYFRVMADEIFGRRNFVGQVVWRSTDNSNNDAKQFSVDHNYIIVYSKKPEWETKKLHDPSKRSHFKNPDNDPRGPYFDGNPLNSPNPRKNLMFDLEAPNGKLIKHPPNGWRWSKETIQEKIAAGEIRFTSDFRGIRRRTYLADMKGLPPSTLWADLEETGHNRQAKYELKTLFPERAVSELFSTPKPERLIRRILNLATDPGDLVLDSFAGSGTTGAVAQKMGRRWVMVELGEHAVTYIVPRMRKVIQGTDSGGVTEVEGWKGGGGFRFYQLAPSMLERDRWGNWVVSKDYNPAMLAEAMCRHMGFTYAPSQDPAEYWKHGHSTERDFIYVTTQALTHTMLAALSNEVGPDRRLLVCCKAFSGKADAFDNLTIRKIPNAVLANCEWGRDDYSLKIATSPEAPASEPAGDEPEPEPEGRARKTTRRDRASATAEPRLFDATSNAAEG